MAGKDFIFGVKEGPQIVSIIAVGSTIAAAGGHIHLSLFASAQKWKTFSAMFFDEHG
jgi:hypothetical protein